ncbi:MAG: PKD domain-containing protein [Bacteroidota bacterium]
MIKKLAVLTFSIFITLLTQAQTVTTFAGQAGSASTGISTVTLANGKFNEPYGIVFDASGRMYVSEQFGHRVLMYNPADGNLYPRVGSTADPANGLNANYINGTGINVRFNTPMGMAVNSNGDVFVADMLNHSIRKISKFTAAGSGQVVTTYAGEDQNGNSVGDYVNGQGTAARFNSPTDIAIDEASGVMYVADAFNDCIRKIDANGNVTLLAGTPGSFGFADGAAASAKFDLPIAVELESSTSLLVADANNRRIRRIDLTNLTVSTVAGSGSSGGTDGSANAATFSSPNGLAVDGFGNIYVADGRNGQANTIRKISNGQVSTIAGKFNESGTADGQRENARFNFPGSLAFNAAKDELYVTDVLNHTIRKITLKPIADFSTFSTTVNVNVEITLEDKSKNAPTSYLWEITPSTGFSFTSSTGNTSQNPKVTFTQTGSYTVKLTVSNVYGSDVKTVTNYITVSNTGGNAPIADFNVNRTKLSPNDTLVITDATTNNPTQWEWTVAPGNAQYVGGTTSSSQNPKLKFTQAGIYTIALKATNPLGNNTKTKANYVYVFPLGIETITLDELVNVYPNPTSIGKVTIDMGRVPAGNTLTVAVYDINGKTVYTNTLQNNPGTLEVNLEGRAKGMYFVTVFDGYNKASKTVVIE